MLNNMGIGGMLLIAVVVLVLFGRGKVAGLMGEVGKGIQAFKRGMKDGAEDKLEDQAAPKDVTPRTEAEAETVKDKA